MPFDGLTIRAVSDELNNALLNARIDKIFQPEKDEIVFLIRQTGTGNNCRLLISANATWSRIHLDDNKKTNPSNPPSFCMLLRKYLEGGKIKEIKQLDFERIVHITIEALDDFREWKEKILICEFMGRHANIILVNPANDAIIDAIHRYSSDVRDVTPGKPYVKPPEQGKLNPLVTSVEEFSERVWSMEKDSQLGSALFNIFSGISPVASKDICFAAGFDPLLPTEQCGIYELESLFDFFQKRLQALTEGLTEPSFICKKGQLSDYSPFNLLQQQQLEEPLSMNQVCSTFYSTKWQALRLESFRVKYQRLIKEILDKANKKRFHQEGDLGSAYKNEKYKVWGELLTSYAHTISKGETEVVLTNFYTDLPEKIELDVRYTPIQNAQKYFKIYNKSRRAILILEKLLKQNALEIEYLESTNLALTQAESLMELDEIVEELEKEGYIKKAKGRKAVIKEKSMPHKYISSDGFELLVGRNNRQNDLLTLKQSDRDDLWFHTKNIPGAHVIVRLNKNIKSIDAVPDKTIEEAAALAAYYSKARLSDKVPVDYTFRFNVKKPGGAKPGMVIYDNYWTIMANPQAHSNIGGVSDV